MDVFWLGSLDVFGLFFVEPAWRVISPVGGVYLTWGFVGVRFVL